MANNYHDQGIFQATAWDVFLESLPDACFMQTSWWAKFMEKLGWGHFGVVVREGETILGGAQVLRNLYSPGYCFYYIPEGPALPADPEDGIQVFQYILDYIEKMRQKDKNTVSHLRIEPRWERLPDYITTFEVAKDWMEPRNTLCMDLTMTEANMLAQMKANGRYNIGLARRHGVAVVEDASPKGIEDFLRLYNETAVRQNIRGKRHAYFQHLISMLTELNQGSIFFAEYAGVRVATVLTVHFGHRVTTLYAGSAEQHRQVKAPSLLYFEIMLRMKAKGYECCDLYGISPVDQPEHKWANLSSFKRRLGGQDFQFVPTQDYIYDTEAYEHYKASRIKKPENHQSANPQSNL